MILIVTWMMSNEQSNNYNYLCKPLHKHSLGTEILRRLVYSGRLIILLAGFKNSLIFACQDTSEHYLRCRKAYGTRRRLLIGSPFLFKCSTHSKNECIQKNLIRHLNTILILYSIFSLIYLHTIKISVIFAASNQ